MSRVLATLLAVIILLRRAFVADDAWWIPRTLDNLFAGAGLSAQPDAWTWAFGHPLWLLLHAPGYAISGDFPLVTLSLSLLCAGVGFYRLSARAPGWTPLLLTGLLAACPTVAQLLVSGLELPLVFLLITSAQPLAHGLAAMANPLLLLLAPKFSPRALLPAALWLGGAALAYGSPLTTPMTAWLSAGVGLGDRAGQGIAYLLDAVATDPVAVAVLVAGGAAAGRRGWGIAAYVGMGVVLGGDAYRGAWLAPAVLVAMFHLARLGEAVMALGWQGRLATVAGLLVLLDQAGERSGTSRSGVRDPRAEVAKTSGIENFAPNWIEQSPAAVAGMRLRGRAATEGPLSEVVRAEPGLTARYAGPKVTILDPRGSSHATLALQPLQAPADWPDGERETKK